MRNVIRDTVVLAAPAEKLFEMYLDPVEHAKITGSEVTIGPEEDAPFQAFEGMLTGAILAVARPTLIVQAWRSGMFHDDDPDSTLILTFTPFGDGELGQIDLVHLDVPDHDYEGVTEGWERYYWSPWREYLEQG